MELFKLLGTIALDNNAANAGIDDTTDRAEKAEGKMSKAFKKIGTAVAAAFATERIIAFGKAIVNSYADYEQLVGGVDTLFKESSKKVQEYANNAYMTAGLSANQYMETVTSFSASLLQSLNGDTAKAAEVADKAITDMSDNANKMGTSMESIQNAYQGFAKQNYTMLDNLKLGYGGTKEEMERLLADAEKLSGQKFDLSSYADIVEAIHVVQTEMGITGTTAKEAATTIQGSIASMKGAWQNLLTGIAAGDQDLTKLLGNLITSLNTVGKNLIPRVGVIFKSLGTLILDNLANGASQNFPVLMNKASEAVSKFAVKFKDNFPKIVEKGLDLIIKLAEGILKGLPQLIAKAPEIINNFVSGLAKSDGKILKKGYELIKVLITGIANAVPVLLKSVGEIGLNLVKGLWQGISNAKDWVLSKIKGFGSSILDGLKNIFGIHSPSAETDYQGQMLAMGLIVGLNKKKKKVNETAEDIAQDLLDTAENTLKEYKRINDMSAAQEANYWAVIARQCEAGTDARLAAEDRYYSALESYKQQYESYVSSIMNQTSLFDAFTMKIDEENPITGYGLINNLKTQVSGLESYYSTIEQLQAKIGGTALFDKLQEMGTESLAELQAINAMSEAQLQEYVNLYDQKYELAKEAAKKKLGEVTETVKDSTAESNKVAGNALKKMVELFKTYTGNITTNTSKKFASIVSDISSKMASAVSSVKSAMAEMEAATANANLTVTAPSSGSSSSGGIGLGGLINSIAGALTSKQPSKVTKNAAGGILTKPTIFGYTPSSDTYHLGGEAGKEAIAPIDVLQGYVSAAVAEQNAELVAVLQAILQAILNKNTKVYLDGKEISKAVNKELGVVF